MPEQATSQHLGVILAAIGVLLTLIFGVQSSPHIRYLICSNIGLYCTRSVDFNLYTMDYARDARTGILLDGWTNFLVHAGALSSDSHCLEAKPEQLAARGFSIDGGIGVNQTIRHGGETWEFSPTNKLYAEVESFVYLQSRRSFSNVRGGPEDHRVSQAVFPKL